MGDNTSTGEEPDTSGGQDAQHVRDAARNNQRADLRRDYQDDFIQLRINEQQRQYTFNIMRDFVFLGIFLYYFFFRDILGIRNLMFHFIYTGLTGKIYNETEIEEATKTLLGSNEETMAEAAPSDDNISADGMLNELVVQKVVRSQPNSTRLELLNMFVLDYVNKSSLEAWNRQQKNQRVNRSDMVLPIILFLMLASLAATIWEVVQVRFVTGSTTSRDGIMKTKKHSLSRKCSLADLTVLRHDRKELRRKESSMAMHQDHGSGMGPGCGPGGHGIGPPGPAGDSTSYTQSTCASSQPSAATTNLRHLQPLPTDINHPQRSHFNPMKTQQLSLDSSTLRIKTQTLWDLKDKSSAIGASQGAAVGLRKQMRYSLSLDNPLGVTGSKNSRLESVQGVSDMFGGYVRQRRAFKIMRR